MNKLLIISCVIVLGVPMVGCVESQPPDNTHPFQVSECGSVLAIIVDQSGSFANYWDDKAHRLFLELMDQFFTEGDSDSSRVVIGQLSGNDEVVLFEGRPEDLRAKFRTPEELNEFLRQHADPAGSQVYQATERTIGYVSAMPGVTENTRLMTVILSDMVDSGSALPERSKAGAKMLNALTEYRQLGGGVALYYVAKDEMARWREVMERAGFQPGSFVIESTLVARPQLPRFE